MSRDIKFKYIFGVKGKPKTFRSIVFTLEEIERMEHIKICLPRDSFLLYRLRYTGLKDSNEAEIYEGDVLKLESQSLNPNEFDYYVVKYTDNGCFVASGIDNGEFYFLDDLTFVIAGNIHKNPDLTSIGGDI